MNVSRVGMSMPKPTMQAQPSFKGWVTDGKTAVRDECVVRFNSKSQGSKDATMHLYDGTMVKTGLATERLARALKCAHDEGLCVLPENSFIA